MIVEGNIIKIKDNHVFIKQFYSGYTYRCAKEIVRVKVDRNGKPELANNKYIGRVEGIGCSNDVDITLVSMN